MGESLQSPLQSGLEIYREAGLRRALREGAFYGYESLLRLGCSLVGGDLGDNVYDDEWDVLLILDACRADLMDEVRDEYPFLADWDTRWSVGSTSAEWMANTFDERYRREISKTTYVTGNPFSDSDVDKSWFAAVDERWRTDWDEDAGTIRPRPLTDAAIRRWRESGDDDRLIVHYMQPHYPFVGTALTDTQLSLDTWGTDVISRNVWERLRDGDLNYDDVWAAYQQNLRTVLNDVELLLEAIDAETVAITADHGNALGEYGVYGHPGGVCLRSLREVPWVTTTAERVREYEPETADETDSKGDVTERLEALGYR